MTYADYAKGYSKGARDERARVEPAMRNKNDALSSLTRLLSERDATIKGLQQNIEDLAARLKAQDDDVIKVGDVVQHGTSGQMYKVHELNADGTEARFEGWLNTWSYERSFFKLENYTKVKG